MQKYQILNHDVDAFLNDLELAERSRATIKKYRHDLSYFFTFLDGDHWVSKQTVIAYKEHLEQKYAVSSTNSMLAALNCFFKFCGWTECQIRLIKMQRSAFHDGNHEIQKDDYMKLLEAAATKGDLRLYMLLQTLCATGIRVSEIESVTVEAARKGRAAITNKGKNRVILIPQKLSDMLLQYCQIQNINTGSVFITRTGKAMNRSNIWRSMKNLCKFAEVPECKVYPHNLRHLFARSFYEVEKDIIHLADILGHSNVNTTRIYIITSGKEHERQMDALGLVRDFL